MTVKQIKPGALIEMPPAIPGITAATRLYVEKVSDGRVFFRACPGPRPRIGKDALLWGRCILDVVRLGKLVARSTPGDAPSGGGTA